MAMEIEKAKNPKWMTIVGWTITTVIFLMMGVGSIVTQIVNPQMVSQGMAEQ